MTGWEYHISVTMVGIREYRWSQEWDNVADGNNVCRHRGARTTKSDKGVLHYEWHDDNDHTHRRHQYVSDGWSIDNGNDEPWLGH